jgi:hypothetical protein
MNRLWTYTQSTAGDLIKVKTPSVSDATLPPQIGGGFPNGITQNYDYTNTSDHNLWHVFDLQEPTVASVTNYYDVLQPRHQTDVGGSNSTLVPAGGTYVFKYETLPGDDGSRTLCVDPNGNVDMHVFDVKGGETESVQFSGRLNPYATINGSIIPGLVSPLGGIT